MADTSPPRFMDTREMTGVPFACPTHGEVSQVLQFNGDPERCYCAACLEDLLAGGPGPVQTVVKSGS